MDLEKQKSLRSGSGLAPMTGSCSSKIPEMLWMAEYFLFSQEGLTSMHSVSQPPDL
jgi:hypothetical protein